MIFVFLKTWSQVEGIRKGLWPVVYNTEKITFSRLLASLWPVLTYSNFII